MNTEELNAKYGKPTGQSNIQASKPDALSSFRKAVEDKRKTINYEKSDVAENVLGGGIPYVGGAIKSLARIGEGIGSEVGKAGLGLGQTALKGLAYGTEKIGMKDVADVYKNAENVLETAKQEIYTKPFEKDLDTISGKTGQFIGKAVPFVATTPGITSAQQFAKGLTATNKILGSTKVLPYVVEKAAQILPEAIGTGATQYAVSGGDTKSAKEAAIAAGIFSGITHVGSDIYKQIIPQTVKENVARVIQPKGKIGLKEATGKKINESVGAFQTMNNLKDDIKVTDAHGIEKAWEPKYTNFYEMPQALYQTKNKIYQAYTDLANQAGDSGVKFTSKDFSDVIKDLSKYNQKGYTSAYSNKARDIINAIERYTTTVKGNKVFVDTDPADIQRLIENINVDVNPLSDKAAAQVANEASIKLRSILDNKISQATGAEYQQLRNAYAQLKTIEPEIINQYKKVLRNAGFVKDVVDSIGTVDTLQGMLTKSAPETIRGLVWSGVTRSARYLRDPEVNLRRAFSLLDEVSQNSPLTERLVGPTSVNTDAYQAGVDTRKAIGDFIKNPQVGLNIGDVTKNLNSKDLSLMEKYINNVRLTGVKKPILSKVEEADLFKLNELLGLKEGLSAQKIANQYENIVSSINKSPKPTSFIQNAITGKMNGSEPTITIRGKKFTLDQIHHSTEMFEKLTPREQVAVSYFDQLNSAKQQLKNMMSRPGTLQEDIDAFKNLIKHIQDNPPK